MHNAGRGRFPSFALNSSSLLLAVCTFVQMPAATAQVLVDPTRPPAGISATDKSEGAAAGPVLQSVMISPTSRLAVIDGETVKLGGKYGEARVVKITESEVVLRSGSATETLKMYPGVELTPIKPSASVPAAKKPARKARPKSK